MSKNLEYSAKVLNEWGKIEERLRAILAKSPIDTAGTTTVLRRMREVYDKLPKDFASTCGFGRRITKDEMEIAQHAVHEIAGDLIDQAGKFADSALLEILKLEILLCRPNGELKTTKIVKRDQNGLIESIQEFKGV